MRCQVCNKNLALYGRPSLLTPPSLPEPPCHFAYCLECFNAGREPLPLVLGVMSGVGPHREAYPRLTLEVIDRNLAFHGLTWEGALKRAEEIEG